MDNITHTLSGLILARAGLGKYTRFGTLALVVGSNFPDVDVLIQVAGRLPRNSLLSHRGVTHGLALAPLEAILVSTAIWAVGRRTSGESVSWPKLTLLTSIGLALHLLLDYSNSYGVRLLEPFSSAWWAWDLTSLMDFWILMILLLGFVVPALLKSGSRPASLFASSEAGPPLETLLSAAGKKSVTRRMAFLCVVLLLAYLGLKHVSHELALSRLDAFSRPVAPIGLACFSGSMSPFHWNGIVEDRSEIRLFDVGLSDDSPVLRRRFSKSCPESLRLAALKSREVTSLLSFARFPLFTAEPWTTPAGGVGYTVRVEDLRWWSRKGYTGGPQVKLWLDDKLAIVREELVPWG